MGCVESSTITLASHLASPLTHSPTLATLIPPMTIPAIAPSKTTCCIVGGGPAGMMLSLLLARAGIDVTVLEKHKDFFRDFRGDTIHPSTLELMHELGLLEAFLALPHQEFAALSLSIGGVSIPMADFSHLPTAAKFIALMPQWDFLSFLAAHPPKLPTFHLLMDPEVTGLPDNSNHPVTRL